jgi:repressor LexA
LNLTSKARRRLNRIGEHFIETADGIPLVGAVAAGLPVEAVENRESMSVSSFFGLRRAQSSRAADDVFALEVRGDSMAGENIKSGDYVICRRTSTATDGQLVVALVDNDNATLKRFYKERSAVRLEPANDDYEPIYSDNCLIQGVVIGLVRKL